MTENPAEHPTEHPTEHPGEHPAEHPAEHPPTLVLIHGLGATAGVWDGLVRRLDWPGRVLVPDLPGHGGAAWTGDYTLGALAAAVAAHCHQGERAMIVGHSLGGAVGVALASGWFRPDVVGVLGLGIKVRWSADDVAGMAAVAARGVRWFPTREDAAERFLRMAGLAGVSGPDGEVGTDHPAVVTGVTAGEGADAGRWRLTQDPATFAQVPLDMAQLLAAARCPVVLGAGAADAMCPLGDLQAFVPHPVLAPARGHNVQVEDPDWVLDRLRHLLAG